MTDGLDGEKDITYTLGTMFAVIQTGGKQYVVREGLQIKVEKLPGEKGDKLEFEVLLLAEDDGSKVDIGTPVLSVSAKGEIVEHGKTKKIDVVKYKPKSRYTRRIGHRQQYTKVRITSIA